MLSWRICMRMPQSIWETAQQNVRNSSSCITNARGHAWDMYSSLLNWSELAIVFKQTLNLILSHPVTMMILQQIIRFCKRKKCILKQLFLFLDVCTPSFVTLRSTSNRVSPSPSMSLPVCLVLWLLGP